MFNEIFHTRNMAGLMVDDLFCFALHNTKASKKEESATLLLEVVVFERASSRWYQRE